MPELAPPSAPGPLVAGPINLELVGQLGGDAQASAFGGGRLFVGVGPTVVELHADDPSRPRELATSSNLPGTVTALAATERLVIAALGDAGIAVLDPADELATVSSIALPGYTEGLSLAGSLALVANGPAGLRVVDLGDPRQPHEVGLAFDLHRIMDVAVVGDHAFLAAADEGLLVADISDPTAPRPVASLFTGGYGFNLDVDGDTVYLADGWSGVRVLDITSPTAPRLITTIATDAWAMDVEAANGMVYVAAGRDGLRVIDVANPLQPKPLGEIPLLGSHAVGISVHQDLAIVVDSTAGLRLVDVSQSEGPTEHSVYVPFASAQAVVLVGGSAYVAAVDQGVRVVDLADPSRPREVGAILTEDPVNAITSVGTNVFFGGSGIFGLDAADGGLKPEQPLTGGLGRGLAVSGSTVLVANEFGLLLFDGSRPSPCELAFLPLSGDESVIISESVAIDVTSEGSVAWVATTGGLAVVDIANPRQPLLLSSVDARSFGFKSVLNVLVRGASLYVLGLREDGTPVVAVIDSSTAADPQLRGSVPLPALPHVLAGFFSHPMVFAGGRLLVADAAAGLVAVDVSDPDNPAVAGSLRLPGRAASIEADDELAYIASRDGGLFVVGWAGPSTTAASEIGDTGVVKAPHRLRHLLRLVRAAPACVVTSTQDAGPGSLRGCLDLADKNLITFDPAVFPADRPATIHLAQGLSVTGAGLTIDATGAGVVLDGGGKVPVGIIVRGATIIGLQVLNFAETGVIVAGSGTTLSRMVVSANTVMGIRLQEGGNRIVGCLIGPDASGTRGAGRQDEGIFVSGNGNVIGGKDPADRNVISGNQLQLEVKEAWGTIIEGNYVGTDITGAAVLHPFSPGAMYLQYGAGGTRIAGNVVVGVINVGIDPGAAYNAIVGNLIGLDATGTRPINDGEIMVSHPYNRIGGTLPGEGNTINGRITAGPDVLVLGNQLGVDVNGSPLPGASGEILIEGTRGAVIGGRAPGAGNLIAQGRIAIQAGAESNLVLGNRSTTGPEGEKGGALLVISNAGRNFIVANVITESLVAVFLDGGTYENRFVGNALVGGRVTATDEGAGNRWDDGRRGNYWSDHSGADANRDGILDVARVIPPLSQDRYPLGDPP